MNIRRAIVGPLLSFVFLAFFAYMIFGVKWSFENFTQNLSRESFLASVSGNVQIAAQENAPLTAAPEINAESAISVETDLLNPDKVLFSKNEQEKLPIASVSKLMTALVFVENGDISQQIKISNEAVTLSKDPEPLQAGETYYAKDLLYTMLIGSDNAAAYTLSEAIGADKFVALMNAKAQELGLKDTSFLNPTGLGLSNFSTAQDLAKLAEYILKNHPSIFGITNTQEFDLYTVDGKTLHKIKTTDELLNGSSDLTKRIFGGKTGDTPTAGECLLLVAKPLAGQGYLINIVLNSNDRFGEMKKIISWVDSAFRWQAPTSEEKSAETSLTSATTDSSSLGWEEAVSSAPWENRDSHAVVVYDNKIWMMGGLDANGHVIKPGNVDYVSSPHFSDVWSSADGVNWTLVAKNSPWGDRRSIELVNFKGKIWMMGGYSPDYGYRNDVWSTTDGINWKQETASAAWPAREGHQLVVFQDKIWIIGGVKYDKAISAVNTEAPQLFNDVWYSADGINWTESTEHAGWEARWDHAVTVFQNKLWLVDGMVFGGRMFKDVWSSADGVNWTLVSANPPFETRQGNFITEYKGKLWVIGRLDAAMNGGVNDIWYSGDGVNWEKTKNNPLWLGREDFAAVIFQDKIWIIGGMSRNWTWTNDVWYSTLNN